MNFTFKMSTKEKLIERFKNQPKDFTWEELVRLLNLLGFTTDNKGRTSGSRVLFENRDDVFTIHKPHPKNIIKTYLMKQVLIFLIENNYLK